MVRYEPNFDWLWFASANFIRETGYGEEETERGKEGKEEKAQE